jgi:hypothetical protein
MKESAQSWWPGAKQFIINDWQSHRVRFVFEMLAWAISIGCSLVYAITVPHLPFVPLYAAFIIGCVISAGCAYSRGSFGIFGNYVLLATIDSAGLIKLLLQTYVVH